MKSTACCSIAMLVEPSVVTTVASLWMSGLDADALMASRLDAHQKNASLVEPVKSPATATPDDKLSTTPQIYLRVDEIALSMPLIENSIGIAPAPAV